MRGSNLQDAISELIAKGQTDRSVLHVAHDAVRLAKEYGGDSREIAVLITNAGLVARINMEMDMPKSSAGGVLNNPPHAHRPIRLADHLAALAETPQEVADLVRDGGPKAGSLDKMGDNFRPESRNPAASGGCVSPTSKPGV